MEGVTLMGFTVIRPCTFMGKQYNPDGTGQDLAFSSVDAEVLVHNWREIFSLANGNLAASDIRVGYGGMNPANRLTDESHVKTFPNDGSYPVTHGDFHNHDGYTSARVVEAIGFSQLAGSSFGALWGGSKTKRTLLHFGSIYLGTVKAATARGRDVAVPYNHPFWGRDRLPYESGSIGYNTRVFAQAFCRTISKSYGVVSNVMAAYGALSAYNGDVYTVTVTVKNTGAVDLPDVYAFWVLCSII